jgi:hypothetical protein
MPKTLVALALVVPALVVPALVVLALVVLALVILALVTEMEYTHCKFLRRLPRYRMKEHSEGSRSHQCSAECTPRSVAHCSSAARRQKRSPQC